MRSIQYYVNELRALIPKYIEGVERYTLEGNKRLNKTLDKERLKIIEYQDIIDELGKLEANKKYYSELCPHIFIAV